MDIKIITGLGYSFLFLLFNILISQLNLIWISVSMIITIIFFISYLKNKMKEFFGYTIILIGIISFLFFFGVLLLSSNFNLSQDTIAITFLGLMIILSTLIIYAGIIVINYKENFVDRWIKRMLK